MKTFRGLNARERALVAIAVLLDGFEAATYLEQDAEQGEVLSRAALELAAPPPELRMPLVGSMLRLALEELSAEVAGA